LWEERLPVDQLLERIIEDAREADSPLNNYFEWDDAVAAQESRFQQARTLIRLLEFNFAVDHTEIVVRSFQNVRIEVQDRKESFYVPTYVAMENPEMRTYTLATALRDFERLRRKYAGYSELGGIFQAIDEAGQ